MTAMTTIYAFNDATTDQKVISITILVIINILPIFYARVLKKRRTKLHQLKNRSTIGSLYEGFYRYREQVKRRLRLDKSKKFKLIRRTYIYPMAFLWRRSLFIVLTVWVFDYPVLQMAGHLYLTLFNMCLLIGLKENFLSKQRMLTELFAEGMTLVASIWIQ